MSRFCVIAGTKISLTNGNSLPIEQIKAGEEVLSFDLNTLQRSQKYDVLVKLKTNDFSGIIKKDYVKNIWKNTADEYFAINDRLKITGDHIVLAKRDNTYYWTKVFNLKIGDYLFTEFNVFEKIETMILIKEKVKVFNLEVNSIYNYFANSYLIHNGAPCSACVTCGKVGSFVFSPYFYGSLNWVNDDYNNWISYASNGAELSSTNQWSDQTEQASLTSIDSLISKINSDLNVTTTTNFSRRAFLPHDDTEPAYSARGLMPFFNTISDVELWFEIINVNGSRLFGIGIMHKFVDTSNGISTWITRTADSNGDLSTPTSSIISHLAPPNDSSGRIPGNSKMSVRFYQDADNNYDTNIYGPDGHGNKRDIPIYSTVSTDVTNSSSVTINDDPSTLGIDSGTWYIYGHGAGPGTSRSVNSISSSTLTLSSSVTFLANDIIGFSEVDYFGSSTTGRYPAGMGITGDYAYTGETGGFQPGDTVFPSTELGGDANGIVNEDDKIGIKITNTGSPNNDGTGGQLLEFKYYDSSASTITTLFSKHVPTHYFDHNNKLKKLSDFDGARTTEGAWCPFVFDSTTYTGAPNRYVTLEVTNPPT